MAIRLGGMTFDAARKSRCWCRGLTVSLAAVSTTPSPFRPVEAVTDTLPAAAFPATGQSLFAN